MQTAASCYNEIESMKLAIVLSGSQAEINWNALRLANLAMGKGDKVAIFLVGEGVEYEHYNSDQFDIKKQVERFLDAGGEIIACGTCLNLRKQAESAACPAGRLDDWYRLISESDKVLTF